jgi:C4-dicarboxylate-binding protein DctP
MKKITALSVMASLCLQVTMLMFPLASAYAQQAPTSAPIKLRCSGGSGSTSPDTRTLKWWSEEVPKRTNSRVKVEMYIDAQLFKHDETPDAVISGAVEMGYGSLTTGFVGKNPVFEITSHWFLLNSFDAFKSSVPTVRPIMWSLFEKLRVKPLFIVYRGQAGILTKKAVREPADMKGLIMRSPEKPAVAAIQAYGATPAMIPTGEVYDAFAKGTIDGIQSTISTYWNRKWGERGKYLLIPVHFGPFCAFMNIKTWNSLPQDIQTVIMGVNTEAEELSSRFALQEDKEALENMKNLEVHTLTSGEVKQWAAPLQAVYANWLKTCEKAGFGTQARQVYDALRK